MFIRREQADRYVQDLMYMRNQRLVPINSEEDTFGGLVADAMNSLELVYVVYRGIIDSQDPTEGVE